MSESREISVPAAQPGGKSARRARCPKAALPERNLAIFRKVEIERFTHEEVAHRFKLRRSRVSQIVKQVRLNLAGVGGDDPEIENHLARQKLQRGLEKLRLEYALEATAEVMRREERSLMTKRSGSRDKDGRKEDWHEVITHDKPANLQAIKTFLRVTQELGKQNEREIAGNLAGANLTQFELFQRIADVLSNWHESEKADPPSDAFCSMVRTFTINLRRWMFNYRSGWSTKDAWPLPDPSQPPASSSAVSPADAAINQALTTLSQELTLG
jgi:hypothetical protein